MPETSEPAIGPAQPGDAAALAALEQRCFSGDRLSLRQYRRHLRSRSAIVLAARRGPLLIGSAVVFLRAGSPVARLYSIAVDPAARGSGLGAALLRAAECAAGARGAAGLRLEVRQDNPAAIALYESRGYARIGVRKAYYEDGADAWRYARALT
jgi:ribosomal protein S18 acetylase RimI-like enzyme